MIDEGQQAPEFKLANQDGKTIALADLKGKWVILYFYPKAMTSGCTTETRNFQTALSDFKNADAVVLGVSKDSVERQKKFAEKEQIDFDLLSDEQSDVCERYGVWQKKNMYGREYMGIARSTFIIDPDGKVVRVYPKVSVKAHHEEVLNDLNELRKA